MTLPRLELEPGWNGKAVFPCEDYTDLATMLDAVRDGMREYPDAELLVVDDLERRRVGFEICIVLGENEHWWQFFISCQHFNLCLEGPNVPAEWEAMRTQKGRLAMVDILRREARGQRV